MKYVSYKMSVYKFLGRNEGFYAVDKYGDVKNEAIYFVSTPQMMEYLLEGNATLVEPEFKEKEYWPKVWKHTKSSFFIRNHKGGKLMWYYIDGPANYVQTWQLMMDNDGQPHDYSSRNGSYYYDHPSKLLSQEEGSKLLEQIRAQPIDFSKLKEIK